ncbi:hypothetical protein AB0B45_46035 [Nonomuraea sp. NPDC049152]|uniref:hypothetical protein n=1 Tax=Nonomuraea sp. NPDC049152 TaxID=3154350 RepID=UPI0033F3C7B8
MIPSGRALRLTVFTWHHPPMVAESVAPHGLLIEGPALLDEVEVVHSPGRQAR